MNIEDFREYCLSKKGVEESLPFDDKTLVFKVGNKMFALLNINNFQSINLKCNPEVSLELREQYQGVKPGFHMNKKHWNSVFVNDDVDDKKIFELTDHSYHLVIKTMSRAKQKEILDN